MHSVNSLLSLEANDNLNGLKRSTRAPQRFTAPVRIRIGLNFNIMSVTLIEHERRPSIEESLNSHYNSCRPESNRADFGFSSKKIRADRSGEANFQGGSPLLSHDDLRHEGEVIATRQRD
jgi:hypothetical protein